MTTQATELRSSILLPFEGLYQTELDDLPTREAEYQAEQDDTDASGLLEHFNYPEFVKAAGAETVDVHSTASQHLLGFSPRFVFSRVDSPREYNFLTDRLLATVPQGVVMVWFLKSQQEDHATLAQVLSDWFTDRPGFVSFYSDDVADWLESPVTEWDENQLGALYCAIMQCEQGPDWQEAIFESTRENLSCNGTVHNLFDWSQIDVQEGANV